MSSGDKKYVDITNYKSRDIMNSKIIQKNQDNQLINTNKNNQDSNNVSNSDTFNSKYDSSNKKTLEIGNTIQNNKSESISDRFLNQVINSSN